MCFCLFHKCAQVCAEPGLAAKEGPSPNDGGQHRSERGRVRQLGNQAECGSRIWTCLHCRHVLSPALAWPDRALRRSVWALTAQQLVRSPVCTVLRGTAADLAVLARDKHARKINARMFALSRTDITHMYYVVTA